MARRLPFFVMMAAVPWLWAAVGIGTASAQSLDYGALETLFGEPVTLSATGKPQRASDAPATMEIITAEQIRRSASTDIPGILRRLAGIDVYRASANGADVSIRGYTIPMNGRILVLLNGRQIYNDSFGFISWGLLPVELDEIRQIEVIKGPQSALYGFNAAAGVINILTFDPLDSPVNSARIRGGSQADREASAVVTAKPGDRAAVRFSVGGMDAHDLGNRPDVYAVGSEVNPQRRSVHGDGAVRFDDGSRFGLEAGMVSGRERRLNWGYFITDMFQRTESIKADYSVDTKFGLITAAAYRNQFQIDTEIPDLGNSSLNDSATVASLQDLFKIGSDHSIRLAAEYRRNESSVYGNSAANLRYQVGAVSAMWDWAMTEAVSLTNALRYDRLQLARSGPINANEQLTNEDFNRTIQAFSFNSGLVWRVDDQDTARLTAARGLNLPSLSNLGAFEVLTTTPLLDYGNPRLEPSVVWNYELSWDHALPALAATTRASLFFQQNDGVIDYAPTVQFNPVTGMPLLTTVNYGSTQTTGVELGMSGKIEPRWTWGVNYTFQTIWDQLPPRSPLIFPEVTYDNRTPRHKVNARLGYTDDPWEVDLDVHYLSRYTLPDATASPLNRRARASLGNVVILEPRVGYHLTSAITLELSAQGLWQHRELSQSVVEPQVLFSVVGRW